MSDVASDHPPVLATDAGIDRLIWAARRDRILPILAALSLIVHATIFLPSFLHRGEPEAMAPKEIPVEIVQLPPPPQPKAAKRDAAKAEPPKQTPAKAVAPRAAPAKPKAPEAKKPEPAAKPVAQKSGAERLKDLLGPMPAIALPSSAADGTEAASYAQLVLSKVAKAKKEGRYQGHPAAASVSFSLGDTGEVAHVEIVRPSGDASLDAEAVAMVKRAAPYPAPPPGGRRDYTITLRFQSLT